MNQTASPDFSFKVHATDGAARTGEISLPRGKIRTPAFMPVGTAATVKAMQPQEVRALGADVVLGNTYHLMLRPGAERVAKLGGLHKLMNWPHPILTDSGGFQVMSLAKLRKLNENGVTFQSHIDGSKHELTPERSMEIQRLLGSDIQMQFDECVKLPCSDLEAERAMLLSLRWAERSKIAFGTQVGHAIFGINQGGAVPKLRKLNENGGTFQSHIDGSKHELTPERSMEIQRLLGSDIQMQFDECVKLPCSDLEAERAMLLSLRWAERSKIAFGTQVGHAIFGINQGGAVPKLRIESAKALADMGFHGHSIGGLAVGEPQEIMLAMIETVMPYLPETKPRYLMGVGTPDDLLESVRRGVDMFDCVMPTRAGRHGLAYTRFGKVNLRNARHVEDPRPLDEGSSWETTRTYARAYLHHLVKSEEILGMMLLTSINLAYYQELMAGMRASIAAGTFEDFYAQTKADWARGDVAPL